MSDDDDASVIIIQGKRAAKAVQTFARKPVFNVQRWHFAALSLIAFLIGLWAG